MEAHEDRPKEGDVDPTVLVFKNIPFEILCSEFQDILHKLTGIRPQSLNYMIGHGGNFQGRAFGNYKSAEDTAHVIMTLAVQEIGGRKIKAEYKRIPPPKPAPDFEAFLNDPEARAIFEELTFFKQDPSQQEMRFPSALTSAQRKKVHEVAEKLKLFHHSQGEDDDRYVLVTKQQHGKKNRNSQKRDSNQPLTLSPAKQATDSPDLPSEEEPPRQRSASLVKKKPQEGSALLVQVKRQPLGPDGSSGFKLDRKKPPTKLNPNAEEFVPKQFLPS